MASASASTVGSAEGSEACPKKFVEDASGSVGVSEACPKKFAEGASGSVGGSEACPKKFAGASFASVASVGSSAVTGVSTLSYRPIKSMNTRKAIYLLSQSTKYC